MLLQRWKKRMLCMVFQRFLAVGSSVKGQLPLSVSLLHKAFPGLLADEEGFSGASEPSVAWLTRKVLFLNTLTTLRAQMHSTHTPSCPTNFHLSLGLSVALPSLTLP